jgi:hypothetical protein
MFEKMIKTAGTYACPITKFSRAASTTALLT